MELDNSSRASVLIAGEQGTVRILLKEAVRHQRGYGTQKRGAPVVSETV